MTTILRRKKEKVPLGFNLLADHWNVESEEGKTYFYEIRLKNKKKIGLSFMISRAEFGLYEAMNGKGIVLKNATDAMLREIIKMHVRNDYTNNTAGA